MNELSLRWVFVLVLTLVFGYVMWRIRLDRGRLPLQLALGSIGMGILFLAASASISLLFGFSIQDALFLRGSPGSYGVVCGYAFVVAGFLGSMVCLFGRLGQDTSNTKHPADG